MTTTWAHPTLLSRRPEWQLHQEQRALDGRDAPHWPHQNLKQRTDHRNEIRRRSRILIVDDDPSIQLIISTFLEGEGYAVETASNGEEALERIATVRPTIVLLDMRMPIMDGWAFAQALRERGIEIPVVVMTAAQDARQWATEIDAEAYLAKPFELSALLSAVDELCRAG